MKPKKVSQVIKTIPNDMMSILTQIQGESKEIAERKIATFDEMKIGGNPQMLIPCKIINCVEKQTDVPM